MPSPFEENVATSLANIFNSAIAANNHDMSDDEEVGPEDFASKDDQTSSNVSTIQETSLVLHNPTDGCKITQDNSIYPPSHHVISGNQDQPGTNKGAIKTSSCLTGSNTEMFQVQLSGFVHWF